MLYLSKFEYLAPQTSEEACSFLSQYKDKAKILAGGTDLLPKMKQDIEKPRYLVDIKNIDGLSNIDYNERDGLWLGALVTISDVVTSPIVNHKFGILGEAARTMASRQVRNRATIGGNLCNASPAADTAPALISLGGQARIAGLNRERVVPLEGFFSGPGRSVLRDDEILTGIQVPNPLPHTGGAYLKLSPREKDLATVAVAALITLNSEGTICEDARVVLGAVAPTVIRAFKAEEALMGKTVVEAVIRESAQKASEESQPIADIRGSAEYMKEMVAVQARRAIKRALETAKSV
jgi:CO/xanthine dehydrogenase FAD-binding subunit